ncbi:hypothetical protein PFISCL1PPCAC_29159, partial [Pristionchus fissidentatus]
IECSVRIDRSYPQHMYASNRLFITTTLFVLLPTFFFLWPFLLASPVFIAEMVDVSRKIEQIDNWRREAFYFSSSDQMGVVISRALELLLALAKAETTAQHLKTAADSLQWDRNRSF